MTAAEAIFVPADYFRPVAPADIFPGAAAPLEVDLGCGDGTTAIPMARLGAKVTGIDIASNLVEAGNRRAASMGLKNLEFREGDACDLRGVQDKSFDLVVSIFGAMFAPKPFDVAREMVRVTKPGGHIVMGNWIPNDPTLVAQILKISSSYSPPPPEGFISPMTWGVEANVIERFGAALELWHKGQLHADDDDDIDGNRQDLLVDLSANDSLPTMVKPTLKIQVPKQILKYFQRMYLLGTASTLITSPKPSC